MIVITNTKRWVWCYCVLLRRSHSSSSCRHFCSDDISHVNSSVDVSSCEIDHSVLPCSSTTTQDVTPSAVPSTDPQSISIHPTNDKADCVSVFNLKKIYNLSYRLNGPKRAMEANVDDQFERLCRTATPLTHFPYEQQLKLKEHVLRLSLKKVVNILDNKWKHQRKLPLPESIRMAAKDNSGCICPLVSVRPSPVQTHFRNKETLTIGPGVGGECCQVGLTIGRDQFTAVVPSQHLSNVKPSHIDAYETFKSYLDRSAFRPTSDASWEARWTGVMIRSNTRDHIMLVPFLKCKGRAPDVVESEKRAIEELTHFYGRGSDLRVGVNSLYIRVNQKEGRRFFDLCHLGGDTHIYEQLLGCMFRISPDSFFQLNSPAAEVLYTVVREMVQEVDPHTLLDVGCGTGTIGILSSDIVHRIIGIDIEQQAVDDAQHNACLNGVKNATYFVGAVRVVLKGLLAEGTLAEPTLAVVNPGRLGVHRKVIERLRCCEAIKHIIYISCKPCGNAIVNFAELLDEERDDLPGQPYSAVKAVGVDMFPQTIHSELVLLFSRATHRSL